MSDVTVRKTDDLEKGSLPVFQEIEKRFEAARRRAYELFEGRNGGAGSDWEDWLRAENEVFGEAKVELEEKAGQFEIRVELAGFKPGETEVTAAPGEIAIHAKHEEHKDGEERSTEVIRKFELSKPVRTDQVTAKLKDGVLHITAPCSQQAMSAAAGHVTVAVG